MDAILDGFPKDYQLLDTYTPAPPPPPPAKKQKGMTEVSDYQLFWQIIKELPDI